VTGFERLKALGASLLTNREREGGITGRFTHLRREGRRHNREVYPP